MSTTTRRIPLSSARKLADQVQAALTPACERLAIAGSVRRGEPRVGDIELVAIPKVESDLFGQPAGPSRLDQLLPVLVDQGRLGWIRGADRYKQFVLRRSGLTLDLFIVTPQTWGVHLAIRTGPREFSKALVTERRRGGRLRDGLVIAEGRVWPADGVIAGFIDTCDGRGRRHGERFFFPGDAQPLPTPEEADFLELAGGWLEPADRRVDQPIVDAQAAA